MARAISARIEVERPDIDRETFVEPREMCSTTHVHDDHRLVVIESGKMVFWGTPQEFRHAQHPAIQAFLKAEERHPI